MGLGESTIHIGSCNAQMQFFVQGRFGKQAAKDLMNGIPLGVKTLRIDVSNDDGATTVSPAVPPHILELGYGFLFSRYFDTVVGRKHCSDVGAVAIGEHLPPTLQSLHLHFEWCQDIEDEGALTIAKHMPATLASLNTNFGRTKVDDDGASAIAEKMPATLTSLNMDFSFTNVGNDGASRIAENLPATLTS